ncbi:MAG TPA: VTT domain-containing protein [Candidatus Paceibacterota bacterium]
MSRKETLSLIALIAFFILSAWLCNIYESEIKSIVGDYGYLGMIIYILFNILSTVIAPINAVPLFPVATMLWGPFITAILSIIGWTLGSILAFLVAVKFGKRIVSRIIDVEKLQKIEDKLRGRDVFWWIVLIRMIVPVDILSYAIGLFVPISLGKYTLATLIGVIPFAFIYSYLAFLMV